MKKQNGVIMQYFEWYLPSKPHLWNSLKQDAAHLSSIGITAIWIPPAYKGAAGIHDVGYGVYDLYDLGEFDQKGCVETKYGTKQELLDAIDTLHEQQMDVYADIVFDHKMGADETQTIEAVSVDARDRDAITSANMTIEAWTKFTFPGRNGKYSDYVWGWNDFDGIDYDQKTKQQRIFRFYGKDWDSQVDQENENYDYLMGADIDFQNPDVIQELDRWGNWFLHTTNIDGFRMDAIKHIQFTFYRNWLNKLRQESGKELFSVGEYWSGDVQKLIQYLEIGDDTMSLFDVPLHYHFYEASCSNGNYDMSKLLKGTLLEYNEAKTVTFVDNHDTQVGQSLQSWVLDWFKPMAYAMILLRKQGYPCIFYGDYYGIPHDQISSKQELLDLLLMLRKHFAYGDQIDYFDHPHVAGFTRMGDDTHPYGMAVIFTDQVNGQKKMCVGKSHAHQIFVDCLNHQKEEILLDEQGIGIFPVSGGSISIYIPKDAVFVLQNALKELQRSPVE